MIQYVYHLAKVIGKSHMPSKAPPIPLAMFLQMKNTEQEPVLGASLVWSLSGLRYSSILSLADSCF